MIRPLSALLDHTNLATGAHCRLLHGGNEFRTGRVHGTGGGHELLIITATNRFITAPIAAALEVKNLIACEAEIIDGVYTGLPSGIPSYQAGKVTRLHDWLERHGIVLDDAWFYSDSHNDLPLLELADNPVAVDPDDTMRAKALELGWPVISLR